MEEISRITHALIRHTQDVIRNVFNGKEAYAICLKTDGKAIGAIEQSHTPLTGDSLYRWDGACPTEGRFSCRFP